MVRLCPELDSSQEAHGRLSVNVVCKLHHVQILHSDPPVDSPENNKNNKVKLNKTKQQLNNLTNYKEKEEKQKLDDKFPLIEKYRLEAQLLSI